MLVLQDVAARLQPLCWRDREPCPSPALFCGGGSFPPPRALGILDSVPFQGTRAGVASGATGCLSYWSAGKS